MQTATRSLRARIADSPGIRPHLSAREIDRKEAILRAATTLMADFAATTFTLTQLATAIETTPATIRRYFIDLDGVLSEILSRHLLALAAALGKIAPGARDQAAAGRAAYLAYTRTPFGGLTPTHLLFTRDRFCLPPEDRARLDAIHLGLGQQLGGLSPADVLSLLDSPVLEAREIEDLLAARAVRALERSRLASIPPDPEPAVSPERDPIAPPPDRPHAPPHPIPLRPPVPAAAEHDWMPSPSLYERHLEAVRARAGP